MSKRLTADQVAEYMHDLARVHASQHNNRNAETWSEAEMVVRRSLIETDEQRRERFEAWWRSENKYAAPDAFRREADLKYAYGNVRAQFEAWQAALTWHGETEGGGA